MSKKDEIIEVLKRYEWAIDLYEYEKVASEIAKLFEVEGKVEYVLQRWRVGFGWKDFINDYGTEKAVKADKAVYLWSYPKTKLKIIKRTTIDEIVE